MKTRDGSRTSYPESLSLLIERMLPIFEGVVGGCARALPARPPSPLTPLLHNLCPICLPFILFSILSSICNSVDTHIKQKFYTMTTFYLAFSSVKRK